MAIAYRPEGEARDASNEVRVPVFLRGAVVGAVGAKNFDKIKDQLGPLLAKAGEAAADAYADAARRVAERVESVQDSIAEASQRTAHSRCIRHFQPRTRRRGRPQRARVMRARQCSRHTPCAVTREWR